MSFLGFLFSKLASTEDVEDAILETIDDHLATLKQTPNWEYTVAQVMTAKYGGEIKDAVDAYQNLVWRIKKEKRHVNAMILRDWAGILEDAVNALKSAKPAQQVAGLINGAVAKSI